MKDKLKQITDSTINELLCNDVILPSTYFQYFDKNAKNIDIAIDNDSFEKELSELILDEYNSINSYVNDAVKSIDSAATLTLEAQNAIKSQDTLALKHLYSEIKELQIQLQDITDNIYKDYLTKVHNKKWLYHKYLSKEANYKKDAIIILIDVVDFNYIAETYNKLISNNLLIYISKYLQNKLKEENINFEISRYLTNKFIVAIDEDDISSLKALMNNISTFLYNTTLKSNSGIMLKPTFEYSIMKVKKDDSFLSSLEMLLKKTEDIKKK